MPAEKNGQHGGSGDRPALAASSAEADRAAPRPRVDDLTIYVIVERDENGERLVRELQRLRHNVRHLWPIPAQLPLDCDVIFCALARDLPQRIPWVPGDPSAALVLVDTGRDELDLSLIRNCAAHGALHYPGTSRTVQATLMLAREHFGYERRLRGRIDKLDENLRSMRVVERAKALLMGQRSFSEEAAYNFLRQRAMERRVSIGTIAAAVVDTHDLLG